MQWIYISLFVYLILKFSYASGYAAAYIDAEPVADSLNIMVAIVIQYCLDAFGLRSASKANIVSSVALIPELGFLSCSVIKARGVPPSQAKAPSLPTSTATRSELFFRPHSRAQRLPKILSKLGMSSHAY